MSDHNFIKFLKIALIANVFIEIGITIFAVFFIKGYFIELFDITEKSSEVLSLVIFSIIIVVLAITLAGYVYFDIIRQQKDKGGNLLIGFMILSSSIILFIGMFWIYTTLIPGYEILPDPFALSNISPILADLYLVWWFLGFIMSILIVTIVVVLTVGAV